MCLPQCRLSLIWLTFVCVMLAFGAASRGLQCSLFSSCTSASCILFDLFIMTVVVPLTAFLRFMAELFFIRWGVSESPLGIERQKKLEKFAILARKPRIHAGILIYRTWLIPFLWLPAFFQRCFYGFSPFLFRNALAGFVVSFRRVREHTAILFILFICRVHKYM